MIDLVEKPKPGADICDVLGHGKVKDGLEISWARAHTVWSFLEPSTAVSLGNMNLSGLRMIPLWSQTSSQFIACQKLSSMLWDHMRV